MYRSAVPPAVANQDWPQPGGNASKSLGHAAVGTHLSPAWHISAGEGSSARVRLAAPPVVGDGRIYVVDSRGVLRAV
jgi:hypothetical protein